MSANLDYDSRITAPESKAGEARAATADNPGLVVAADGDFDKRSARVTKFDRWLARKIFEMLLDPPFEGLLWDGKPVTKPIDNPVARLQFNNRSALFKILVNAELYFGDLYASGEIAFSGDLVRFLEIIYTALEDSGRGGWLRRQVLALGHRRIANSHEKAKNNIYHHYDIGNDFYELWLDRDVMQYTCAYFPDPEMTLEQAQVEKLHHVCRKLQLRPGESVVEAGCGWGGLARFMAKHYGVKVRAYNISKEQVAYAHMRAEQEGLAGQVEYVLDDYRNISGKYDAFVSVGMLEHVGKGDFATLGKVVNRCLKPEGRGLIHSIGRNRPAPMNAWIERRIFPGAYPPAISEMMHIFEPNGLSVLDIENLRLHYSKTLEHWLRRYNAHQDRVREMMDAEFVKTWRLYLAGSIAAFNAGELQLFQVVFSRKRNNRLAWSREHLYPGKGKKSTAKRPKLVDA